jgi:hypothetical protein
VPPVVIAHDKACRLFFDKPGREGAASRHSRSNSHKIKTITMTIAM